MNTTTVSRGGVRAHGLRATHPLLVGAILLSALPLADAAKASWSATEESPNKLITYVCQLRGEVGPVAADHPAAAFVGLPVTAHAVWITLDSLDPNRQDPCHGGEISLNVGGTLRVSPITPEICSFEEAVDAKPWGRVEINIPGSPFSPTLFAFAEFPDPRPATLTGLDELVIAGECYVLSEEEIE